MSLGTDSTRHAVLIILLIVITGIATVAVSGTVAAQSETDIRWTGSISDQGSTITCSPNQIPDKPDCTVSDQGETVTQGIAIESVGDPVRFGAETGRSLRIQNIDTGESITISPTGPTYQVTTFELFLTDFVNRAGDTTYKNSSNSKIEVEFNQNGTIDDINEYPVNVNGDPTAFFEETFYEYNIQLLDSKGNVMAETDETQIRGAGYDVSYEYNGSALAVERDSEV
jgi:hypothetical protein